MVPLPAHASVIGSKRVYSIEVKSNGSLDRYKVGLVAQGFKQEYGIDYEETFAPVAKMTMVHCLLSVAAARNWPFWQMDVKNAFLHSDLRETVYMSPPLGYACPPRHVCKLKRSLYGHKQAPRAWFDKFHTSTLQAHFHQSPSDSSLFIHRTTRGCTMLLIYIDDMIISGNNTVGIAYLKIHLMHAHQMKDLGSLTYFLGLEISRSKEGSRVNQTKYADDLIK